MDLYLAGPNAGNITKDNRAECFTVNNLYILESFYYLRDWMLPYLDNKIWNFMLDSGAFTFMEKKAQGVKSNIENALMKWDDYVCRYADFIIEHDIERFFELDIDVVVGLPRVEQLRKLLEKRTGRQCIPVWHKSRGLENWKAVVNDYPYVAIGGIVSGEIRLRAVVKDTRRMQYKYLNALCDIAHEQKTRVHGLGVSPSKGLNLFRFDSVDSTSWTMGNRAGHIFRFTGSAMEKIDRPIGTRMNARESAIHNFSEWVKYQRYMLHAGWSMNP